MAMSRSKLNMIRARVEVEYEGDDGIRYEMTFDVTPAEHAQSAVYLGVEPHFAGLGLDVEVPRIIDYDLDLQFEKVLYKGLVKTVTPELD